MLPTRCCFFVPLKTATILLACFGAVTHLYAACSIITLDFLTSATKSSAPVASLLLAQQDASVWDREALLLRVQDFHGLVSCIVWYDLIAALVCSLGIIGVFRRQMPLLRVFTSLTALELLLSFSTFSIMALAASIYPAKAATMICDKLTRGDFAGEAGVDLSIEACEEYLPRVVTMVVGLMAIVLLVKFHYFLCIFAYYRHLSRTPEDAESSSHMVDMLRTNLGTWPLDEKKVMPSGDRRLMRFRYSPSTAHGNGMMSPIEELSSLTMHMPERNDLPPCPHHHHHHPSPSRRSYSHSSSHRPFGSVEDVVVPGMQQQQQQQQHSHHHPLGPSSNPHHCHHHRHSSSSSSSSSRSHHHHRCASMGSEPPPYR